MKHLSEHFDEHIYTSSILDFYFKDMKLGVLDIETTGLNPSRNKFILGGCFDLQTKTMHQFFAESRSEEMITLAAFYEKISEFDMVITYNGRHFDIPFIEKRMSIYGMEKLMPYDLDIYLLLNGHSPIKQFVPNLKQKTVENYMGLWQTRADEISGAESVELYNEYEKSGSAELEEKILLHNSDDVLQLTRLIKVIAKCDFHKAMYHMGFPVWTGSLDVADITDDTANKAIHILKLTVRKIHTSGSRLIIEGIQDGSAIDYMGFAFGDFPAESRFERKTRTFTFRLPVIRDSGLCIIDIDAAGLNRSDFEKYPAYSSGFLVLEEHNKKNFMETNHFVKAFISQFMNNI